MSKLAWDNGSTSTGWTDLVPNDVSSRSKPYKKTSRSVPSSANIGRRKNYPRASLGDLYGDESKEKTSTNKQDCIAWQTVSQQLTLQLEQKYRSQLATRRSLQISTGDKWKDRNSQELPATVEGAPLLKMDAHIIPMERLLERFHSNLTQGLTDDIVAQHHVTYGPNKLTPLRPPNPYWLFFKQLIIGFNSILWIAALFAFLSYKPFGNPNPDVSNLGLGVILVLVIVLNALFNFYQEFKSMKIISSFSKMQPKVATVKRNGIEMQLNVEELVPGDIVRIRLGDRVPADCRIISCDDLQMNNSQLTGESAPVTCTIKCTDLNFMESTNIIFYSSFVVQGAGEGLVINTGDETVLGQVGKMTHHTSGSEITGLHREINRFVLFIFLAALTCIVLLWTTWAAWLNISEYGYINLNGNVINSIGMVVCFIPEGLPAAVTLVLTIVAKRMYKQKVMVKSLATIETFNSVSVIATDKTGTLTMNEMTITALLWGNQGQYMVPIHNHHEYQSTHASKRRVCVLPESFLTVREIPHVMKDLILGSCLCNNTTKSTFSTETNVIDINNASSETTQIIGDAADVALYHFCQDQCSVNFEQVKKVNPRINTVPFNSKNKFMITANILEQSSIDSNHDPIVLITLKGAPDFVLSRCSTYRQDDADDPLPMADEFRRSVQQRQEQFGKSGYRVIAMLQQQMSKSQYDHLIETYKTNKRRDLQSEYVSNEQDLNGLPANNYCFIGMFALLDPARPEVPDVVLKARHASIRVAMVTGDHPTTATAIAKMVNIFSKEISVDNGTDTFQIDYNNQTNQTVAYFMRNANTLLQSHTISEVQSTIDVKGIKPMLISKEKSNILKRIWNGFLFYLRSPNEIKETNKQEIIPYAVTVTGSDMHLMDNYMWDWALSHQEIVFARTSPEQKLRIIMEFSNRGEVVAVTGDGTNDAPALKQADLGIVMAAGTDVAKEAGDLILLDNNFASIINAIEMGRLLSDNLKKVTIYLLPGGTWSEVIPVLASTWFGIPLSLSLFLGVVFCMFNDIVNSLAMVSEKPEEDIMSRPPAVRHKNHLVDWKLLVHAYLLLGNIECFSAYFCFFWYYSSQNIPISSVFFTYANYGIDPPLNKTNDELANIQQTGQSIYFISLCIMQMFNLLSTRTRHVSFFQHNPFFGKARNWTIIAGITFSTTIGLIITLVPWFNSVFKTQPVPVKYICPAIGFGAFLFVFDETRKFLLRRYPKSFVAKMAW